MMLRCKSPQDCLLFARDLAITVEENALLRSTEMGADFQAKTVTPVSIRPDCLRATVKREDGLQVEPPGGLEL